MNVAAFILALLGFLCSLHPLFYGLSMIFFLIALPLGIIGLAKKKESRGLGITAIVLIIAAFAVAIGYSFMAIKKINANRQSNEQSDQIQITGFGGYELGEQLDPNNLSKEDLKNGYVRCPAKKQFRNFGETTLYFTPKTFHVYQISSLEKDGSEEDAAVIKASVEKKYEAVMEKRGWREYSFTRNHRRFIVENNYRGNFIYVIDHDLQKLNEKEKKEIAQSKVDTTGL